MLDTLSVQGNIDKKWDKHWKSILERLKLIAHEHPDLFTASLTNFFFYKDEVKYYGPKVSHVSFLILWSVYLQISLLIWYRHFSHYSSDFQEEKNMNKEKR
jgi:hypothetical protein